MDLSAPSRSLAPSVHLQVLAVLARTEHPLSGRAVGRLLAGKASSRGVAYALTYLVAQGVVRRDDFPPAALYRLNREHVAAAAAEALGDLWGVSRERCQAEIAGWALRPAWAALFGSAARGDGIGGTDVDVALVVPDDTDVEGEAWADQVGRLARGIRAWVGNPAAIITFAHSEFAVSREPVVAAIRREGLTLWGQRPAQAAA
jgi:hypothetical protein